MKTLRDFIDEYRLTCSDTWGCAMEAWFECAGQLTKRGMSVPNEWEYRPPLGSDGTDEESYWYELFEQATPELMNEIGEFLFRYCMLLKRAKKDY